VVATAILTITEGQIQVFQQFSSSKLVLQTFQSRFMTSSITSMAVALSKPEKKKKSALPGLKNTTDAVRLHGFLNAG
jgi:hypothetical protein